MSPSRAEYAATLAALPSDDVAGYLTARSNLPGPRANLTLLDAAADVLPRDLAVRLAATDDEYLACAGVVALGRAMFQDPADAGLPRLLTARAADERWRVREAVAMAAQHLGDRSPAQLRDLVAGWVAATDPLVARAGVAAICEPRLLRDDPVTARAAVEACVRATATLLAVPAADRRCEPTRVLRQALGYCWSVAVVHSPDQGLPLFDRLPVDDPDVGWVVRSNRAKKRLAPLLAAGTDQDRRRNP